MQEELRKALEELEFNPKKCGEIISHIIEILHENNCSPIETAFIIANLTSINTNASVLTYIDNR